MVSLTGVDRAASEPGTDTGLVRISRTGGFESHDKVTEQGISQLIKQAFDKGLLSG